MNVKEFFDRDDFHYFFDDKSKTAQYCRKNFKDESAYIIKAADDACDMKYTFELKCDLEQTHEPVIFDGEIDWRYMPADDPEFIYQFNRHRYFICLGQAYALTGDEKYSKAFVSQLTHWIEHETFGKEGSTRTSWRTIDTGFRGEYWSKAIRYFKDSPYLTGEVLQKFYDSMTEQAEYLAGCYSPYHLMSNWGVIENHGLFEIAVTLPQSSQTAKWADLAMSRLTKEIGIQVMNDGVHWEQSPMYHNEVLHCFLDVLVLAMRNRITIPDLLFQKVKAMTAADIAWIKPDHCIFMQGDSDDTDFRNTLSVSAYVYREPVFKFAGYQKLDYDSIWDLGIQAEKEYEAIIPKVPDYTSASLTDSGNYYLRSDWGENADLLHFHCGTMGAGHGHSDKLHIDLIAAGEDILTDAGRYTYVAGPDRYSFKDPEAHNTITVDGKKFTVCKDSWECSKLSQPVKQGCFFNDRYEFVQGGHLGYMDEPSGVFVNRKIVHIKPDIYVIMDEMYTGGSHTYQQYFHFNENGQITQNGNSLRYTGKKATADFYFLSPLTKSEITDSRISRHYNSFVYNKAVRNEFQGNGFASAVTVVITETADGLKNLDRVKVDKIPVKSVLKNIIYPDQYAEAVKIDIKNKKYVIILCHQEVNSPTDLIEADGCMGFGNVIVFEPDKEKETGCVLNW